MTLDIYRDTIYPLGSDGTEQQSNGRVPGLSSAEYRALAEFRHQIRCFLRVSEEQAREAGVEPQQHQLMLAIKGLPEDAHPTVGELAERLQLRHHSTVELIDRSEAHGLVRRGSSSADRRQVIVELSSRGEALLERLSKTHRHLLQQMLPHLARTLNEVLRNQRRNASQTVNRKQ